MQSYFKSKFHKAAMWFFIAAMITASPMIFLSLPALMIMIFQPAIDSSGNKISSLGFIFFLLSPLFASYVLGGLIGKSILLNDNIRLNAARIRGALIAVGSLAFLVSLNCIEIAMTDYANAIETSAERSYGILKGVSLVALPIVTIVGAIAGAMLRTKNRKKIANV